MSLSSAPPISSAHSHSIGVVAKVQQITSYTWMQRIAKGSQRALPGEDNCGVKTADLSFQVDLPPNLDGREHLSEIELERI